MQVATEQKTTKKKKTEPPKYTVKPGARFSQKQVNEFAPEIDRLGEQLGRTAQAADIVNSMTRGNRIFAKYFEVDVNKAAREHWLQQAREMLRSYTMTMQVTTDVEVEARAIEYVPGTGYTHIETVLADEDFSVMLVGRLKNELRALRLRWERYRKIPEIAEALERLKTLE